MSIVDRLQAIAKEKHTNFKQLEKECGLGNGTIRRWENQSPRLDKLTKVANYLHTSLDYLVYGSSENAALINSLATDNQDKPRFEIYCDGMPLSETEADLIAMYRLIEAGDRKTVFDLTKMKYEQMTGEKISIYSTYTDENECPESKETDPNGSKKAGLA